MSTSEPMANKVEVEISGLADFVNSVVEKFKTLQKPLSESREKVPKATRHIDKISEQTEAAAQRMLDKIEQMTMREERVKSRAAEARKALEAGNSEDATAIMSEIASMSDQSCSDLYDLLDALQFQDITSQQMDYAATMLEDIEEKLHEIIEVMHGDVSSGDSAPVKSDRQRVFDPHADFVEKKTEQDEIDSLFADRK